MKDNKIIIRIKNNKIAYNTDKPLPFDDLMTVFLTLTLGAMNNIVDGLDKEELKIAAKGALYDMFNVGASNVLAKFAPEFELRPNLTTQAILEAENRIIMEGRLGEVEAGT